MAYNDRLAQRVRVALIGQTALAEKKMFGGLAFMVAGHMCCGVRDDELVVRVGPAGYEEALAQPHARLMDFTGRPMKGFVMVSSGGCRSRKSVAQWVDRALNFVTQLPPK